MHLLPQPLSTGSLQLLHYPWEQILPPSLHSSHWRRISSVALIHIIPETGNYRLRSRAKPQMPRTEDSCVSLRRCTLLPWSLAWGRRMGEAVSQARLHFPKGKGANFCLHGQGGCRLTALGTGWKHASQRLNIKPLHSDCIQVYGQVFPLAVYWLRDL